MELPTTRPEWRTLHIMFESDFHKAIKHTYNEMNLPVINSFIQRYDQVNFTYTFRETWHRPLLYIQSNRIYDS